MWDLNSWISLEFAAFYRAHWILRHWSLIGTMLNLEICYALRCFLLPPEDEQIRRFESHNCNGSFPYLKTIRILNLNGSVLPLVKYFLNHAIVLEKFDIVAAFQGSDASLDYVTMAQELLSYPRSSLHASIVFFL